MVAVWVLAIAVFVLAAAILAVAWAYMNHSALDALSDEEIAERLAPLAAELLVWSSEAHPEVDESELS